MNCSCYSFNCSQIWLVDWWVIATDDAVRIMEHWSSIQDFSLLDPSQKQMLFQIVIEILKVYGDSNQGSIHTSNHMHTRRLDVYLIVLFTKARRGCIHKKRKQIDHTQTLPLLYLFWPISWLLNLKTLVSSLQDKKDHRHYLTGSWNRSNRKRNSNTSRISRRCRCCSLWCQCHYSNGEHGDAPGILPT